MSVQKKYLSAFILYFFIICPVFAEELVSVQNSRDTELVQIKAELAALKNEFQDMKRYYEQKLRSLEMQIKETQSASLPDRGPAVSITESKPNYSQNASIMNPNISAIVNATQRFNDDVGDENRNKLTVGEAELNVNGMLYPDIRGDLTAAIETEYEGESTTETEIDLEEAYITFLSLPFNTQLLAGRKLIDFGLLNPTHTHEWSFTDTPLVLANLFGDHPWFDDGVQGSILIPNPLDLYWNAKFGVWNGRTPGHSHSHDHEEGEEEPLRRYHLEDTLVQWNDMVYTARTSINVPISERCDVGFGYSAAWDEHPSTILHGLDLTLRYKWPQSYRWIKLQNEYIYADLEQANDDIIRDMTPQGFYSLLEYSLNKNVRLGTRFDLAEYNENERFSQWANSYFITYWFSHNLYARASYRYRDFAGFHDMHQEAENSIWLQIVWGLGPHMHQISE